VTPDDKCESLTIGKGKRQVRVRGRIDRIDVGKIDDNPVFNVIDYKSGMPPRFDLDDVRAGLSLQLALYTLAVARMNLAGPQAAPAQMGYWSIKETGFVAGLKGKPKPIDEASMKELEQLLEEILPKLVHGMRSGQFPVDSPVLNCTGRCPYNTVCRVNQIRPLAQKLDKRRKLE
jgi:RecB family exonuclease